MVGRILGTKMCIDGKQYEYWPAGTTPPAGGVTPIAAGMGGEGTPGDFSQVAALLQGIANVVDAELTYQGVYRNANVPIPAGKTNYLVDFGFPVRLFELDSMYPITIRLNDSSADEIPLDYQRTPFELPDIPAGLAFSKIFVTNTNTVDITIKVFAMG